MGVGNSGWQRAGASGDGHNHSKGELDARRFSPHAHYPHHRRTGWRDPARGGPVPADVDLADNWTRVHYEDFETTFPDPGGFCALYDGSHDGYERTWGRDTYDDDPYVDLYGAWPAASGADAVASSAGYPDDLASWLVCGPIDVSDSDLLLLDFRLFSDFPAAAGADYVGWGYSTNENENNFHLRARNWSAPWEWRQAYFQVPAGITQMWFAWYFYSDAAGSGTAGAWLDTLRIWRYDPPAQQCGALDPGDKGVMLPAFDPRHASGIYIIRAGDTATVDNLAAADVDWVRLDFIQDEGTIDFRAYNQMVDTLCAQGISTLGLFTLDTLGRDDYNNPDTAADYRAAFTASVAFIVQHFAGRISYWEVWNEEFGPAEIRPRLYAPLLTESYNTIKAANPEAQVLFGGLGSAWDDAHDYFVDVYGRLATPRPFDIFALHPYYTDTVSITVDPMDYMHHESPTILEKFLRTLADGGDWEKKFWITEVGWNSAKGDPAAACRGAHTLVSQYEQATYLTSSFDILFTEVIDLATGTTPMVEKVFWYQHADSNAARAEACPPGFTRSGGSISTLSLRPLADEDAVPWNYGLYRYDGDRGQWRAKPAQCAFQRYPRACAWLFLPVVLKNYRGR